MRKVIVLCLIIQAVLMKGNPTINTVPRAIANQFKNEIILIFSIEEYVMFWNNLIGTLETESLKSQKNKW